MRSFTNINRCDFFVLIWCIQNLNDVLYSPGIINSLCQILLTLWALCEGINYILPTRQNPRLLQAASLLMLMFIAYGLVLIIWGSDYVQEPFRYLQFFTNSFCPIFLFYKYSKENLLTESKMQIYFFLILGVSIGHYQKEILASTKDEFTNNVGYEFVSLIPLSFVFYKKKIMHFIIISLLLVFVVFSIKRGAIMIGGVCFIWMLTDSIINSDSKKTRYITIALACVVFVASIFLMAYMMQNSKYFQKRVEDTENGNTSRRSTIYALIIESILTNDSYIDLFLGRGAFSTMELNNMAHQDWLQVAYDNGLIGLFLLLYFCYTFINTSWNSKNALHPNLRTSFLMLFFIFFMKTMFSMSLSKLPICMTMLIGYYTYKTASHKKLSNKYTVNQ